MSDLNLNADERALLHAWRGQPSTLGRIAFYAAIMTPLLSFAAYGMFKGDYIAEFIAFLGAFLFLLWRISQEIPRMSAYQSMLAKILEHERAAEATDGT